MKKAEEFIDISKLSFKSKTLQIGIIEEWVKQAQLDAIEEAVKRCAESAKTHCRYQSDEWGMNRAMTHSVNRESILKVAEQLRKEIE